MLFRSTDYLRHIIDEIDYLQTQLPSLTKNQFLSNDTLKRAFVRSIEIIGEATKQVPMDFRNKYPNVPWRLITGMRDRLIHAYFGVDFDIVWDVATTEIVPLKKHILDIIDNEKDT